MPAAQPRLTAEEFLAWERQQPDKHEFVHGEVFAMTGASRKHVDVTNNLLAALRFALRDRTCRAFASDLKVRVDAANVYHYPDLLITCSPADLRAHDVVREPSVIVEVISPSTGAYDRGLKFAIYRQLPSLRQMVFVDPDAWTIDFFVRGADGTWTLHDVEPGADLPFPTLDVRVPWADVFRYVEPPEKPPI